MLNIYYRPSCPYCQRVLAANDRIKAPVNWLDISASSANLEALLAKGGKRQVPFLEDTERGVSMYESLDIIAYLNEHYGKGEVLEVKEAGKVCPIE